MILNWNKTADVLVVGYGFAGAVTAIVAHDLGARVIMLEKQSRPGGLSIFGGGGFRFADDAESAFKYLRRTCLNTTPDDVLKSAAVGFTKVLDFLKSLEDKAGLSYTEKHNTGGTYEFEGGKTFGYFKPKTNPKIERYPWLCTQGTGWIIFKLLEAEVRKRGIEVMMKTRLLRLVTSQDNIVLGCIAQADHKELSIKTRKAVILATGGFEQDNDLKLQFLQGQPVYPICPSGNEGDGIKAAQLVGAKLWHMWHIHGSYGFKHPDLHLAWRHSFGGGTKDMEMCKFPWIIVDKFGRRYMNEEPHAPQDTPWREMIYYDCDIQDYPRIPSYMIFDEIARKAGPLFKSLYTDDAPTAAKYEWSKDNSEEIKKGWISKGETVNELASITGMSPSILTQTISNWNNMCKNGGEDPFRRRPETMVAVNNPPFYAVQIWPVVSNTQGGIAHDAYQRVVDAFNNPIPRLYAAGQISSIFGHLYLQAGNAPEAVFAGMSAAENAVKESPLD